MLRSTIAVFLCAAAMTGAGHAQDDSSTKKTRLIALERMWNQAQMNRDSIAIASMIGDRFVNTEYDGEVSSRGKFLADFADPHFKPSLMSIQNLDVQLYDTTAIVTGDYHTKGVSGGRPYEHFGRFTDTWVSQEGRWVCIASHSSLVKK